LFVGAFAGSHVLGRMWAPDFGVAHSLLRVGGIALGIAALVLLASAPVLFAWRRTTIVPHRNSQSLVTSGPYRITRNPMYLGLALLYLAASLIANAPATLIGLAFPLWVLQSKTIPFEEASLHRIFGESYQEYCRRVRRWM
jgi:protein-S-isoprenylcysteine O-methyltransferase Ste14